MDNMFAQIDFGPVKEYLENDDVTDISYSNNGQLWLKTLSRGIFRIENEYWTNPENYRTILAIPELPLD